MSEQKLKPCPFCGGKANVVDVYPYWVYCKRCGSRISAWTKYLEDSVDAWNRREIDTNIAETIKQAIRDLFEGAETDHKTEKEREAEEAYEVLRAYARGEKGGKPEK